MEGTGSINTEAGELDNDDGIEEMMDDCEEKQLVEDPCSSKVLHPRRGRGQGDEGPPDRYNVVYILFYLFGITSLVPWNFLMTANDYWMYKFRDTSAANVTVLEVHKSQFQAEFTSYLNVATAVPNLIFLILNSLYGHLVSLRWRLQASLAVVCVCFLLTTALVQADTDRWQGGFFILTMVTVVVMTAGAAVFIGGIVGTAACLGGRYMSAVVGGQSLGGIVAALAQIGSLAFKVSPQHSALIYFCIADLMVIASFVSYLMLYRIDFFKYRVVRGVGGVGSAGGSTVTTNRHRHREASLARIVPKVWVHALSIFLIFAVSMSVYPAVTVLVESHPVTKGTDWNNIYFVPVVNYLIFNCGDYSGRLAAGFLGRPRSRWAMLGASVVRAVLVPMLLVCNAQPRARLPVLFLWDWEYICIMILFALSNGYLTNLVIITSNNVVDTVEQEKASSVMVTMLSVGLTVGAALGMALVRML